MLNVITASISRYEQERLTAYSKLWIARAEVGLKDLQAAIKV
jgi:hypothetical protein